MNRQQGFILVIVLIFFQLLFLLGWYGLEMNRLEVKINYDIWRYFLLHQQVEKKMSTLETQPLLSDCMIPVTGHLQKKPLTWWQQFSSCSETVNASQYYYVIEFLGEDPCAYLEDQEQQVTADYYRLTFLNVVQGNSHFFQSTFIKPHQGATLGCQGITHRVTIGRQMWRSVF